MSWLIWISVMIVGGIVLTLMLPRPTPLSANEIAKFIRDALNDTDGEWDWDEFEHARIVDPELKRIRDAAIKAGPPDMDRAALEAVLREAELLAQGEAAVGGQPS